MENRQVPLFWPHILKDDWLSDLSPVFDDRWIGEGPKTKEFEKKFGEKFGYDYCLSMNSATSGLELAYHLAGIGEGDEVLTPVLTCTATNIPLLRRKADIIFVDINRNDFTMCFEDLEKRITSNTKAIVTVNLGGIECDPRIYQLAKDIGVPVIVDAAQSLGITENHGDYVVYSFQAIKHFSCGDGGMLVIRNEKDYIRGKKLRWFGIDRDKKQNNDWKCLVSDREICMDIEEPGYKFHMNDIAATMGLAGLEYSDAILEHRRMIARTYNENIDPSIPKIFGGSCWLFGILVNNRKKFSESLRDQGVECDPVHLRNDMFAAFGGIQRLENMNWVEPRYLYIPIHTKMTLADAKYVVKVINEEV